MTMITPSYLGETIEYSSLHACRSTLEDPTSLVTQDITAAQGITLNRIGTGDTPGKAWAVGVQNAAGTDTIRIACTSTAYTTGGGQAWVGNSESFLYYPVGSFKIGTGGQTVPALKLDPNLFATFGASVTVAGGLNLPNLGPDGPLRLTSGAVTVAGGALYTAIYGAGFSNSNAETSLFNSGLGNRALPANYLTQGRMLRVTAYGSYSTAGAAPGNISLLLYIGTTVVASSGPLPAAVGVGGRMWTLDCMILAQTSGSSGQVVARGQHVRYSTSSASVSYEFGGGAPVTIDTTAAQAVGLNWKFDTASTSSSVTMLHFALEPLN